MESEEKGGRERERERERFERSLGRGCDEADELTKRSPIFTE